MSYPSTKSPDLAIQHSETAWFNKDLIFNFERSAIHGGKLGDIIYALPACRALGINHLILSTCEKSEDPLRAFPRQAAQQLLPLLLHQKYLGRVSITAAPFPLEEAENSWPGVDYNFDRFRIVPRHRIGESFLGIVPRYLKLRLEDVPAHLVEHFASTVGVRVDLSEPWLTAPKSPLTQNKVVISITHNWRSYSERYWELLLEGLDNLVFVGHESEFKKAKVERARFIPTENHLELAALIHGARLFLGTISFPYAIAEGLKVPRLVELCFRNLNAFPVGAQGEILSPDVLESRIRVARRLNLDSNHPYVKTTARIRRSPSVFFYRISQRARFAWLLPNESPKTTLRRILSKTLRKLTLRAPFAT